MSAASADAIPGGSSELSPEEERLVVRDMTIAAEGRCKEGDTFYLITQRWWQYWLDYVNHDITSIPSNESTSYGSHSLDIVHSIGRKRPSFIDNSDLVYEVTSRVLDTGIEIHDTLLEGRDYILLPEEVWKQLHGWYGGGPILSRRAINSGISHSELAIEVYPLRLQLLLEPKGEHAVIRISKKETVGELHRMACETFDLVMEQVLIWDYYGHQKHALMENMEKTLDDSNIQMDQEILVEVQNDVNIAAVEGSTSSVQENGSIEKDSANIIPEPTRSSLNVSGNLSSNKIASRCSNHDLAQSQPLPASGSDMENILMNNNMNMRGASVGLTGLLNLGNTCFMNSAIQCLVHTPEFARYFREDYRQEINWQNPLGMVGELALAFGELLRKLWAPGRTPVSPRPFKTKLARFAPQFSGYNQHDSQELLAFLLDGLHEDLNRVREKPYIETKDADGRLDEEVADEYWQNHVARNDSIIVDVCQGQYKSTLVCPVCGKVSVTFDPFMYLSLPLQFASARMMTVTVITGDGSAVPAPYTVSVPKHGRCKDLIQALSSACSLKSDEKLILAEIRGHLIHNFLEDPLLLLSTIKDDDHLTAYKIPNSGKNSVLLQFIQRREDREHSNSKSTVVSKLYGAPIVTQISPDDTLTGSDMHALVQKLLSPMSQTESTSLSLRTVGPAGLSSHDSGSIVTEEEFSERVIDPEHSRCEQFALPKLAIQLSAEDNECIDILPGSKAIKITSIANCVVYLNWSTKDLERYNMGYFENLPEVLKYIQAPKKARNEPLSLYSCMEAFLREEPLVPEDMWYCPQCQEQRQASKKLDLWRLPEVLVIHLKRFSYSRSNKHKLETFVDFPIHDFDLTKYVAHKNNSEWQLYELYALSNHYGNMASGHYTAHIKLLDENRWYNFDDSHISPINEEEVKSAAAYVLFYRRVKGEGSLVSYGTQSHAEQANLIRR